MDTQDIDRRAAYEREDNWLSLAISGAVISVVVGGVLAWWVLSIPGEADRLQRVQTVSPLGVLAVAAITFATVVWRGLISARQANTSAQQLAGLQKQIALTEEAGLAALLQKGAELIAAAEPAKRSAGVATLHAVATATTSKFYEPSRRLLLDFIREYGHRSHADRVVAAAIDAFNAVFLSNLDYLDDMVAFEEILEDSDDTTAAWKPLFGVNYVYYQHGYFIEDEIGDENFSVLHFDGVTFYNCAIRRVYGVTFDNCTFTECTMLAIESFNLSRNRFVRCDFSDGAILGTSDGIRDLRADGNFYSVGKPPVQPEEAENRITRWSDYLVETNDD
ncbi:right-handed parallel beta-helix repeat-containing protein [Mesorhizobium sp. CA4]|uniref:right-handed parallel beta-helix repeat-containing protein n=1 Tax=Mesorhizobium sp. CA4 TaxID=588499 RepID=UPI001CD0786E|nr:right-handed parallel beta-helix repeat-containing protein [Mesorhizobium sp. CA4]MBZ9822325.1 right-handed parallel beta-helix repeat-containing protein [Mesorhizobium sp. CA4]